MGVLETFGHKLSNGLLGSIHPKSGFPGFPESANYFDFPQSYSLRTHKTTKFSLFFIFSLFFSVFVVEIYALFPQNILTGE